MDEAPVTKSTANSKTNFERKPGMLASLKGRFEQFKATMKEGRERAESALPKQRKSAGSVGAILSNIRRSSLGMRSPSRSRGKSVSPPDHLLIKPDIARQSRVVAALKNSQNSLFREMDSLQKKQLMAALDACAGLSGDEIGSHEGLLLLLDCIDQLIETARDTPDHSSPSENELSKDLAWVRLDCTTRLAAFSSQGNDAKPDTAGGANNNSPQQLSESKAPPSLDDILLELGETKATTTPATINTQGKQADLQSATAPSLDDILTELGASIAEPQLMGPGFTTGQTDRELAIQAELDARLRKAESHPAQSKTTLVSPTLADFDELEDLAFELAKSSNKDDSASVGMTPVNPSIAEFDELDELLMDVAKSARKPGATSQ